MYGKEKNFQGVTFPSQTFENLIAKFESIIEGCGLKISRYLCRYDDDDGWTSVRDPELDYRSRCFRSKAFTFQGRSTGNDFIMLEYRNADLFVTFNEFQTLSEAEELLGELNKDHKSSKLSVGQILKNAEVFIGHGRSRLWRDLKDHLHDQHGIKVTAYETGARAGLTIQEILQELSSRASLALLVHTGEDIDQNGQFHSRENVVHETGLFQGKLGFRRAIVLLEDETSEFSNIAGLQQIRFQKGNIKETFGDVLAILRRELTIPR